MVRRRATKVQKQQARVDRIVARMTGVPVVKATSKYREIGRAGLLQTGGHLQEEFRRDLQGINGSKIYREMVDNSAKIAGALFAIEQIIRRVQWRVDLSPDDRVNETQREMMAEFVETCREDLSQPWSVVLSEILTMLPMGFAPLEVCYKQRLGPSSDPTRNSKYTDGKIGWRKLALRGQDTVVRWAFSDDGSLLGLYQQAPPSYIEVFIPIEKLLLFRPKVHKGDPSGRSVLRSGYLDYYFVKKLTEYAAIGAERNLTGLPIVHVPAKALTDEASEAESQMVTGMQKVIERMRNGEQAGLVFPREFAIDNEGKPVPGATLYAFELISAPGGTKAEDILALIEHHERKMLMALLADFLVVGHEQVGARAVAEPKLELFADAISGWLDSIADVFNRVAIPRLGALNGWRPEGLPLLCHGEVTDEDADRLAETLKTLSEAGLDVFPDEDLARHIYTMKKLPLSGRERMEQEEELETRSSLREREEQERAAAEAAAAQQGPPEPEPEGAEA